MNEQRKYQVVLLPKGEIVSRGCSLGEATAYMETYNAVMGGKPHRAVIAEQQAVADDNFRQSPRAA